MDIHYGFKKLKPENFLEPDAWGTICDSEENLSQHVTIFLEPHLMKSVPEVTRALFEVARGTMTYGIIFYPLYSIGMEQLFRVCENALKQKAIVSGMKQKTVKKGFSELLKMLCKEHILTSEEEIIWDNYRHLRNISSHPDDQSIISPVMAINALNNVTDQINLLFEKNKDSSK